MENSELSIHLGEPDFWIGNQNGGIFIATVVAVATDTGRSAGARDVCLDMSHI